MAFCFYPRDRTASRDIYGEYIYIRPLAIIASDSMDIGFYIEGVSFSSWVIISISSSPSSI
nr:MAG TPA: hypothetical protein [Caudoviricetes sp.]